MRTNRTGPISLRRALRVASSVDEAQAVVRCGEPPAPALLRRVDRVALTLISSLVLGEH